MRHGVEGGTFDVLKTNQKNAYAYRRVKGDAEVLVVLNFSKKPVSVMLKDGVVAGTYTDLFTGAPVEVAQGTSHAAGGVGVYGAYEITLLSKR